MNKPDEFMSRFAYEGLTGASAADLLELGIAGARRPIDGVIDQLVGPQGPAWMADVLGGDEMRRAGLSRDALLHPGVELESLERLKALSKSLESRGDERSVLLYFLSVAAALAHHGTRISSREPSEIRPILIDLASALPPGWRAMVATGAERA